MGCPLCGEEKFITVRRDEIADLSVLWKQQFMFDPFREFTSGPELRKLACVNCGLLYFEPGLFGDSEFYSRLSQYDWYYEEEKWEFDRAVELVKIWRPKSILEIGCGSGEFLQKIRSGVEYSFGIDINDVALAKARAKGLEVSSTDVSRLDRTFDMIVLFEVLEHLRAPGELLKAIDKKLNPNGVLVIAVPNPDGYLKDLNLVLLDMPPHHNSGWRKETFEKLADMLGLKIVSYEVEPIRYVHYQTLLDSVIRQGTRNRYLRKLQILLAKIFAPFLYLSAGNRVIGQTHMVVMKKGA